MPVMKSIPWEEGIGKAALSYLVSGIDNDKSAAMMGLKTVIPEGTECTLRIGEGGSARVDLTDIGQQTEEQEQAMVVAIVNTLTEFPSINNVSITIDGKEKKTLSNGTDISKPMESFALNIEDGEVPVSGEAHAFTLYFPNSAASLNIPVTRYMDTAPSFSGAVQEEIAGPKDEGLINCFPAGTELISAYIKDGIACVDLTKDFEKVADTEGMLDAARDSLYGGRAMPYSVMIPVISSWSVTSKAGLYRHTPAGAMGSLYHMERISSPSRSSMTMASPSGVSKSMVEVGAAI